MATTTLFRLEHPSSNAGPWQTCILEREEFPTVEQYKAALQFRDYINDKLCLSTFPGVASDVGYGFRHGTHHCACPSKTALHKWFDTDQASVRKLVLDAGFIVKRIRIDSKKILRSRSGLQVAFNPSDVESVEILTIEDLTPKKKKVIITASTNSEPAVKKWTKEEIREKMATDGRWLIRGLLAIYDRQTFQEQLNGYTVEDNGIGFNGVDAEILSSIAMNYKTRNFISPKQLAIVQKKMPKYANQLAKIANGRI